MEKPTRAELIQLCEDAVIHHTKWMDRDSYSAQLGIQSIHAGLTAGLEFKLTDDTDEETIWIEFLVNPDELPDGLGRVDTIAISSREEYFSECDPEHNGEMFDGPGIDFSSDYTQGFMPTRKRLEDRGEGNDWY